MFAYVGDLVFFSSGTGTFNNRPKYVPIRFALGHMPFGHGSTSWGAMAGGASDSGLEIAGRYRLERVLGGGSFGQVWRAVDSLRDRPVAVKVLHRDVATSDPVWLTKFRQEARIAVHLSHRNIAAVDDFGEYNGQWYLVMEFLDGVNLDQKIAKNPKGLALSRVLAMATQIAEGLVAAHEHGIVALRI